MISKYNNNQKGYSFVEILVSMTIFLIIIIFSSNVFSQVVAGQHREIAAQDTQETLRFTLEIMSKELRMTKRFTTDDYLPTKIVADGGDDCADELSLAYPATPATTTRIFQPNDNALDGEFDLATTSSEIYFRNEHEDCVHYSLVNEGIKIVRKGQLAGTSDVEGIITPDNIKIKNLKFRIVDSPDYRNTPMVTIMIDAESGGGDLVDTIKLQTTIASRYYPY